MNRRLSLLAALSVAFSARYALAADGAACNQARAIVEEAKKAWEQGQPPHAMLLAKLSTARDLCPAFGDAWKYSYCSAQALGDEKRARIYKERAIFNGVVKLECGGVPVAEPLPTFVHDKFALVVGVGRFADPAIPPLHFAAKDAADLGRLLIDPHAGRFSEKNVYVLTDEQATRANILKALNEIVLRAGADDLVLLFFSTHGSPRKDGLGLQGVGYIIAHDTTEKEMFVNSIEFENLREKVALIAARRKVLLLDTCYSGQVRGKGLLLEGHGIESATAKMFLSGEGTYVITSSRDDEVSYESERLKNGYFTHFLLEALREGPEPPTIREVYARLSRDVRDAVARDKQAAQNPRIFPEDQGGEVRIGVASHP